MNNSDGFVGDIIDRQFVAGFVVLSYLVSYLGSWTTLELLSRRTYSRGFYNWSLLSGAAIAMGGIAIWGMHFIGNRAIVLGDGNDELQLAYSSGFTALSFFVAVIVLFVAFAVVGGTDEDVDIVRVILGGILAGFGVYGMHYLGQAGISNYECEYTVPHVIGAALIAFVATNVALGMFFIFRSLWESQWWSKLVCALILATAVSSMHWLASIGTQYRGRDIDPNLTGSFSRNSSVIGVIVLCVAGCLILVILTVVLQRQLSHYKSRAQQISVAAAFFDMDGKLLVTNEGLLPNRKITDAYLERSIDDVFNVCHPLYIWIFRTSRFWTGVKHLIPSIRNHIHRTGIKTRLGSSDAKLVDELGDPIKDYSVIFRELFCIAAEDLANDLNQPLEKIGVLYDDILGTGIIPKLDRKGKKIEVDLDLEKSQDSIGTGQLMFLVRAVDRREAEHLQGAGYRFTHTSKVMSHLSNSMQIGMGPLTRTLGTMSDFVATQHTLDPGVHVACFTIKASLKAGRGGFDVLVRKDARNLLPTILLPFDRLEAWQLDYLKKIDGSTVAMSMRQFKKSSSPKNIDKAEQLFAKQILSRMETLKEQIEDPFFNDATLVAKSIKAPCRGPTDDSPPKAAELLVFKIIVPIQARTPGKLLEFVGVNFFKMQQYTYKNSKNHVGFARMTHREFAPVLGLNPEPVNLVGKEPIGSEMSTQVVSSNISVHTMVPGEQDRDPKTYVDELFAICIATRK